MDELEEIKPKKKNKTLMKILVSSVIFVVGIAAILAMVYVGSILKFRADAKALTENITANTFRETETSIIYDINGEEITTFSGIKELYYLESSAIPQLLKETFVLIEDQDYYSHNGIDLVSIVRASIVNATSDSIVQGASTITQQLAKNMFLTQDVTWSRKLTEMFVAFELEDKFSKDQILEFYLNNIYFGNGYYGIEAAAEGYFGKTVKELSVSEIAFVASIPKNPTKYDPMTNIEDVIERRDFILKQLYANGNIDSLEYYEAVQEIITLDIKEDNDYNYVETYVFHCATETLMEANGFEFQDSFDTTEDETTYNESYEYYYKQFQTSLFTGGYRIYTSIDMSKQNLLQDILDEKLQGFTEVDDIGIYQLQGAAVCIDNSTGFVTAIVGGRDQEYDGYTFNRAYQSYRQPGSSIKPVLVYAPYLTTGYVPSDTILDEPIDGGPDNFRNEYRGEISLTEALGWSSNVCAWKIIEEITPLYAMEYLHDMNFKKIDIDDNNQSVSIGGFTYGVSPVELASAYSTLANDGVYRNPTCIDEIMNSKGEVIANNGDYTIEVYETSVARMVTKMMEWGVEEGLLVNAQLENAIVAAKSGTTNDYKDAWLAGYSDYYTTVVWVGNDMPITVENLTGGTYPLEIWKEFMEDIHSDLKLVEFPDYEETDSEDGTTSIIETTSPEETTIFYGENELNIGDGDSDTDISGMGDADVDVSNMGDQDAQ